MITRFRIFSSLAIFLCLASGITAAAEVNVYSARKHELIAPLLDKFSKQTGITVNLVTAEDDMLLQRLKTEGVRSPADIIVLADAGRLYRAEQSGVLRAVATPELQQQVPAHLRHPDGLWYGLTVRARVIAYAPDRVKPETLTGYANLADAKWKGRLCARSSGNVYNQSLTAAMLAHDGAEKTAAWLRGMVANFARPPQGGDRDQIKDIATGRCDLALVNTYYVGGMLQSKDPSERDAAGKIALFWPDQQGHGTHVNISGAGVTRYARNVDQAIRLLEFMVSEQSQAWYASINSEYPVRAGVTPGEILRGWGDFKADTLPMAALGEHNARALLEMDKAGWK